MAKLFYYLLIPPLPILFCLIYVKYVLEDDIANYFDGIQPKIALMVFVLFILLFHFLPNLSATQIAADASRHSARLFTLIPGVATSMIIFPNAYGKASDQVFNSDRQPLNKTFYRGLGWVFLFAVVILAIVL